MPEKAFTPSSNMCLTHDEQWSLPKGQFLRVLSIAHLFENTAKQFESGRKRCSAGRLLPADPASHRAAQLSLSSAFLCSMTGLLSSCWCLIKGGERSEERTRARRWGEGRQPHWKQGGWERVRVKHLPDLQNWEQKISKLKVRVTLLQTTF